MAKSRYGRGASAALALAGPVYLLGFVVHTLVFDRFGDDFPTLVFGLLVMTIVAIPFGALFAAIPVLVGGFVMSRLGDAYPVTRHPVFWISTGAMLATPMSRVLMGGEDGFGKAALFAATGAICALIVRYGTRWSDDSV